MRRSNRERRPQRRLVGRGHVRKPRFGRRLDAAHHVEPRVVDRHRHELHVGSFQHPARPEISGILHPRRIAPIEEEARREVQRRMHARQDEDALRVAAHTPKDPQVLGQRLAKREIAARVHVAEAGRLGAAGVAGDELSPPGAREDVDRRGVGEEGPRPAEHRHREAGGGQRCPSRGQHRRAALPRRRLTPAASKPGVGERLGHEGPRAALTADVALRHELLVGRHDGAAGHAELSRQLARGRHARPRRHTPPEDRLAQRLVDRELERLAFGGEEDGKVGGRPGHLGPVKLRKSGPSR